jgi:hypothetical protein
VRLTPPPPRDTANISTAADHVVGYSQTNLPLFKLLVRDYAPIAKNALTILINISSDTEVLKSLAKDDDFLESLLSRITVCQFTGVYRLINE